MTRKATWLTLVPCVAVGCGQPAPQPPGGAGVAPAPRPSVLGVIEQAKFDRAAIQCRELENACQIYAVKFDGTYPKSLDELVAPRAGGPILDGGPAAVLDPWGNACRLEIVKDGEFESPKVTTTAPDGSVIASSKWAGKKK